jgi:alpha-L-rhamnosidase
MKKWVVIFCLSLPAAAGMAQSEASIPSGTIGTESAATGMESAAEPSAATWIWYPGDYAIWLGNRVQNRRTDRGTFFPPFWKLDNHYILVDFHKAFDLPSAEDVVITAEGRYNLKLDSKMLPGAPNALHIPAGRHVIDMKVYCEDRVPAVFVQGIHLVSDSSWQVTFEDKEWIDATGKVSDKSGTVWLPADYWNFHDPLSPPSAFRLARTPERALAVQRNVSASGAGRSILVDFGKETFGYIRLHGLKGTGKLSIYYGESREEAESTDSCETLEQRDIRSAVPGDWVSEESHAFRYVNIQLDKDMQVDSVSMLYEYLPLTTKGSFRCSDSTVNRIWDVAAYTLHLNTREFFLDGIKRDRWIWSGDAYQSYLMNYYLFFDSSEVTRTLLALRGKDPVTSHINTILDYTFFWFMGIYDYYRYTGDASFIREYYPRMVSMMDFVLTRRDKNGMVQGLPGDWVFVDWADGLSKKGELSFEQMLFCRSLETMSLCAGLAGDTAGVSRYGTLSASLKSDIFSVFWDPAKEALIHNRVDGQLTGVVNRYANMFGILFGYFNEDQARSVKQSVLLNDSIQQITTPYMQFYAQEALCAMGEQTHVLKEIKDYWGGMLRVGATTFWEKYDPSESGVQNYALYGRPFGRSLCHAWGASPLYLLGKYYLGVRPLSPGYATYSVEPVLGGLDWMEGAVPTPHGNVGVYCSKTQIRVRAIEGQGILRFKSRSKPVCKDGSVRAAGEGMYEVSLEGNKEYTIAYRAAE